MAALHRVRKTAQARAERGRGVFGTIFVPKAAQTARRRTWAAFRTSRRDTSAARPGDCERAAFRVLLTPSRFSSSTERSRSGATRTGSSTTPGSGWRGRVGSSRCVHNPARVPSPPTCAGFFTTVVQNVCRLLHDSRAELHARAREGDAGSVMHAHPACCALLRGGRPVSRPTLGGWPRSGYRTGRVCNTGRAAGGARAARRRPGPTRANRLSQPRLTGHVRAGS
jgi:hypothetical protein